MRPYVYIPNFLLPNDATIISSVLWNILPWLEVTEARRECWMNDLDAEYTYGTGVGRRTYKAQPWDETALLLRKKMQETASLHDARFEGCFINGYANEKNSLGWHADNSPEIDQAQPIAVISLGAARSIMFRPIEGGPKEIEQITLGNGSLLIMQPGMQQTHLHKIPRHSAPCGLRISLTYRSLVKLTSPEEK